MHVYVRMYIHTYMSTYVQMLYNNIKIMALNQIILYLSILYASLGFCIYGFYGIVHSEQGKRDEVDNEKSQQKYVDKFRIVTSF